MITMMRLSLRVALLVIGSMFVIGTTVGLSGADATMMSREDRVVLWLLGTARELPEAKLDAKRRALVHLARAQAIFDASGCRIRLRAEMREADITAATDLFYATCDSIDRLKQQAGWRRAALNIYYVADGDDRHRGMKGLSCGPQALLITRAADRETLAHEIGHAYGLWHLDTDPANLMASIGYSRDHLTHEQCVRANQAVPFLQRPR
jgi:hypothetical protein